MNPSEPAPVKVLRKSFAKSNAIGFEEIEARMHALGVQTRDEVATGLKSFLRVFEEAARNGETIVLRNIGVFRLRFRKGRTTHYAGRAPSVQEDRYTLKFVPAAALNQAMKAIKIQPGKRPVNPGNLEELNRRRAMAPRTIHAPQP